MAAKAGAFLVGTIIAAALLAGTPAAADVFTGKTIRLVVGTPAGGGYDTYARLVARHIRDYLPGRPTVVVTNMAGASGITATNWLYEIAPKDGSVFGTFNKSEPFYQAIGQKGVRFKAQEFSWIGALSQAPDTVTVWHTAGVKTMADVERKEVVMGADSGGTMTLYPSLLNATIGTRFKIVTGYAGFAAVFHAIEQGEVQGAGSAPWASWKAIHPDWVAEHKIVPLVQVGLKADPDLKGVPRLVDLAQNEEQRRMFTFVSEPANIERPYAAPPGIPKDALAAYRKAFITMVKDPAFLAEAKKQRLDIDPQPGEEVAKIAADIVGTSPEIVAKIKALAAEGR